MSIGNIPISVLLLMFLSCLFKDNIFDSDVRTPSCKNVGDLGVFGWMSEHFTKQPNSFFISLLVLCYLVFPFCVSLFLSA